MAKLAGGVAVIQVGAATETELKDGKPHRRCSISYKSSCRRRNCFGGGTAFINAIPALDRIESEDDEAIGINIVKRALEEPIRQIAENAGYEGSIVVEKLKASEKGYGFDALREDYGDMMEKVSLIPKVTRSTLQNAASIASMVITTEAVVTDIPEKEQPMPQMPGGYQI